MCYSMTVSYLSVAVLAPAGCYAVYLSLRFNKKYLAYAMLPFIFAIQQGMEGLVWSSLHRQDFAFIHTTSLLYLFFAFFLWPFYLPFSIYLTETISKRRYALKIISIIGFIYGTLTYAPLLFNFISFSTSVVNHSIQYRVYESNISVAIGVSIYCMLLLSALLISSDKYIRYTAVLMLLVFIVSAYFYYYTFTSLWCFYSAISSLSVLYVMRKQSIRFDNHSLSK